MTDRIKNVMLIVIAALAIWAVFAVWVYAQDAAPVASPSFLESILPTALEVVLPLLGTLIAGLLSVVLAKTFVFIGVQDEAVKLDIEAKLRKALHDAASNGIEFGLSKLGIPYAKNMTEANAVLDFATGYVFDKNPGTVKALSLSSRDINDIVRTKMAGAVALTPPDNAGSPANSD